MKIEDTGIIAELAGIHMRTSDGITCDDLNVIVSRDGADRVLLRTQGLQPDLCLDQFLQGGKFIRQEGFARPDTRPGLMPKRRSQGPGGFVEAPLGHVQGIGQDVIRDPIMLAQLRFSIGQTVRT